jgi:hypothetical protein
MMRDWAGIDSSSDEVAELVSAGPGEFILLTSAPSCSGDLGDLGDLGTGDPIGNDDSRVRPACSAARRLGLLLALGEAPPPSLMTVVVAEVLRDMVGRTGALDAYPAVPLSLRSVDTSRRIDRAEGVLRWPVPARSDPGMGD